MKSGQNSATSKLALRVSVWELGWSCRRAEDTICRSGRWSMFGDRWPAVEAADLIQRLGRRSAKA